MFCTFLLSVAGCKTYLSPFLDLVIQEVKFIAYSPEGGALACLLLVEVFAICSSPGP